ncbi:hypothetical protein, partial [Mycobacterium kansasii]|uniref:hypothetical protein n=1 Tax=Mycobacterium kansasii TaxID=1768 RepID=UPI001C80D8AF
SPNYKPSDTTSSSNPRPKTTHHQIRLRRIAPLCRVTIDSRTSRYISTVYDNSLRCTPSAAPVINGQLEDTAGLVLIN